LPRISTTNLFEGGAFSTLRATAKKPLSLL
jgi:hypothetical protein